MVEAPDAFMLLLTPSSGIAVTKRQLSPPQIEELRAFLLRVDWSADVQPVAPTATA